MWRQEGEIGMTPVIPREMLEEYLPNPLRRSGKKLRTWFNESRSRTHIAINLEDGVYFDFHVNRGGSLISLMRQFGASVPKEMAGAGGWVNYEFQLSILKGLKAEGRWVGCGRQTAIWREKGSGTVKMVASVTCLQWHCPRCSAFLARVLTEKLSVGI